MRVVYLEKQIQVRARKSFSRPKTKRIGEVEGAERQN